MIAHYPICKWMRPAFSAIKSLVNNVEGNIGWDNQLSDKSRKACLKLQDKVFDEGDVVKGDWSYCPTDQWILWTDASKHALGSVLTIGDKYVEDNCHLRKNKDFRHINVAELDAVLHGIQLIARYIRALNIKTPLNIILNCDNKAVVQWLKRRKDVHWN